MMTAQSWIGVAAVAFIGCVIPYVLWYRLLLRHPVDTLMPFCVLMPVVGVILSIVRLGEPVTRGLIMGGAILILGLGIIALGGHGGRRRAVTSIL
jgi:O-acetylserine/cysteine efflux transporter